MVLSSILLGIWATKGTIALRNILLVCGAFFSVYYIIQEWRYGHLKLQCTPWRVLPICLVGLIFFWVIIHYIFFSLDPVQQFFELKSTWLRALMSSIVGLATGLALRNHCNRLNLIWMGIFVAFLILFIQYIPRALSQDKILVPDYEYYLFHLKINTVLMGMIIITGMNGAMLDKLNSISNNCSIFSIWNLVYCFLGTALVLWAFVFVVDSRIGVGLAVVLFSFWLIVTLVISIQCIIFSSTKKGSKALVFCVLCLCLALSFALFHTNINKGWSTFLEDTRIGVQINQYQNWKNSTQMGYPKRDDGSEVVRNTYDRVSWATIGAITIFNQPLGVGILKSPMLKISNPPIQQNAELNKKMFSTHSGWVELGLAFGIPILCLILFALSFVFIEALRRPYQMRMTILGFTVLILCLYAVGEVAIQHGLEILFYLLTLLPTLFLIENSKTRP